MPPNAEAAAITDAYRRRVIRVRDALSSSVARQLESIDLDQPSRRLRQSFEAWQEQATASARGVQREIIATSGAYLTGYLEAADQTARWQGPDDPDSHVGRDLRDRPLADTMRSPWVAVLYQLSRGAGRSSATSTGVSFAARTARGAVMGASQRVLAEGMNAEPVVEGYRRVTAGTPCLACMALTDGVAPAGTSMELHDNCRCTPEAVLRGVPERVRRPTGSERLEQMSDDELSRLVAGRGGAEKAAAIRRRGLDATVQRRADGTIAETPLADLAS